MRYEMRLDGRAPHRVTVTHTAAGATLWIDGRPHRAAAAGRGAARQVRLDDRSAPVHVYLERDTAHVHALGRSWRVALVDPAVRARPAAAQADLVAAPMPGSVIALPVAPGDPVVAGQPVVVIESMKMQSELIASRDGVVARVRVQIGDTFDRGAPLVELAPEDDGEGDA